MQISACPLFRRSPENVSARSRAELPRTRFASTRRSAGPNGSKERLSSAFQMSVGRREILEIHTRVVPLAADVAIAEITHGFTGADVGALCREAATALRARAAQRWIAM